MNAGKYKRCLVMNKDLRMKAGKDGGCEKVKIKRKKLCGDTIEIDGEEFYREKLEELIASIQDLEKKANQKHFGIAFVVFKDEADAKKFLKQKWLQKRIIEELDFRQQKNIGFDDWAVRKAYLQSDIIWPNLLKSKYKAFIKRVFFLIVLFLLSFIVLAPTIVVTQLLNAKESIEDLLGRDTTLASFLAQYFAPLITLIINFGILPLLVDLFVEFEDYRRKSSK